ncbi:MAG: DUF86 domain-containing protein [Actinomycetota bacterium]|nr:DUF86 domain-containing protein [Actinomycetota bacterium]
MEDIAGFRNRLVHGYLSVSSDVVWAVVEHDLPRLIGVVRADLKLYRSREAPGIDREDDLGLGF